MPTGTFAVSLGMVMPAVMAHASNEVRAKHVGPALTGEHLWCQLLSEPGAVDGYVSLLSARSSRCESE